MSNIDGISFISKEHLPAEQARVTKTVKKFRRFIHRGSKPAANQVSYGIYDAQDILSRFKKLK
jgi:hypothetical protein